MMVTVRSEGLLHLAMEHPSTPAACSPTGDEARCCNQTEPCAPAPGSSQQRRWLEGVQRPTQVARLPVLYGLSISRRRCQCCSQGEGEGQQLVGGPWALSIVMLPAGVASGQCDGGVSSVQVIAPAGVVFSVEVCPFTFRGPLDL